MISKTHLRAQFKRLRAALSPLERELAAKQALAIFTQSELFALNTNVASYLASPHEFDTEPLIDAIWKAKKRCFVPVLTDKPESPLQFVLYEFGSVLARNKFGILEPRDRQISIAPKDLDLVMVPLVAFDFAGHRLGTGGGYYDRTFKFLTHAQKPLLMGLGFALQAAEALPNDPWDIPLNVVLTQKSLVWMGGNHRGD